MTRGTTPTLIFNFCEDIGVFRASKIIVSFAQNGETLFDKEIDIEKNVKENVVTLTLTQEETLAMKAGGYVQYQIRLLINGQAYATPIYKSIVLDVLNETTITAGEAVTEIPHAGIDDIDITNAKPTKATAICECNEICVTVGQVSQVRGLDGKDGKDGIDGKDGVDGFSPTVEVVTNTDYNYTLKITDKNGSYNTPNLKGNVKELNDRINEKIPLSEKSSPNGVATLDDTGRVPATQLPSYVDDVLEFDNRAVFPEQGEDGKIYIAKDTNLQYRWGGSEYVEISSSLALGETPQTAYAGDKGKKNADDIAQAKKDISSINAIYRFSESSISSSFSGQTELYKENMIGDGNPRIGDHVLFPDNKSLVLYIGTISAINGGSYTIDNISYVNEAIKASGDWVMGITANFPEMYNYAGGTYLCLTRDVTTAPVKGEEWFEISKPVTLDNLNLTEEQTASLNSGATAEKIASIDEKLPLSGGTMMGSIDFQGAHHIRLEHSDDRATAKANYISAGGDNESYISAGDAHGVNAGLNGLKVLVIDSPGAKLGFGSDLMGRAWDFCMAAYGSDARISFVKRVLNNKNYSLMAYFDKDGRLFVRGGTEEVFSASNPPPIVTDEQINSLFEE